MIELVYIEGDAPLTGIKTEPAKNAEMVPVVESTGLVVGRTDRKTAHEHSLLHPVIHLLVINRSGEVYLQKRSDSKELCPGLWDCAVSGHVIFGESFLDALFRESAEELNFTKYNPIQLGSHLFECQTEKELSAVYAAVGSFKLNPNPDEVQEGAWWKSEDIDAAIGTGIFTPVFEKDWDIYRNQLFALL